MKKFTLLRLRWSWSEYAKLIHSRPSQAKFMAGNSLELFPVGNLLRHFSWLFKLECSTLRTTQKRETNLQDSTKAMWYANTFHSKVKYIRLARNLRMWPDVKIWCHACKTQVEAIPLNLWNECKRCGSPTGILPRYPKLQFFEIGVTLQAMHSPTHSSMMSSPPMMCSTNCSSLLHTSPGV